MRAATLLAEVTAAFLGRAGVEADQLSEVADGGRFEHHGVFAGIEAFGIAPLIALPDCGRGDRGAIDFRNIGRLGGCPAGTAAIGRTNGGGKTRVGRALKSKQAALIRRDIDRGIAFEETGCHQIFGTGAFNDGPDGRNHLLAARAGGVIDKVIVACVLLRSQTGNELGIGRSQVREFFGAFDGVAQRLVVELAQGDVAGFAVLRDGDGQALLHLKARGGHAVQRVTDRGRFRTIERDRAIREGGEPEDLVGNLLRFFSCEHMQIPINPSESR